MNTYLESPAPAPVDVKVLAWKKFEGSGARRGTVDILLSPANVEILRCGVIQQENQALWVAPPQLEYLRAGETKKTYFAVVRWPRELNGAINAAVNEAIRDFPEGLEQRRGPTTAFGHEVQRAAGIGGRS